jgi:hypothetical protein
LASPGTFIAASSPLARVLVGWVYLLSSYFSFPELLVGFLWAHPSLLPLLFPERVEEAFCELRLYGVLGSSLAGACIAPVQHL